MLKQKKIDFEVNLTRMKWVPKRVSDIPEVISRAFERDITAKMIQPIIGTDHVKEWVLREDADINEFYTAPNMMQEWIAEKVIKVRIPPGIVPKDFQPKKTKLLATGAKVAKFFGEDTCSTRTVGCSLKIFDCNHFYMKQTLPGSGASPHWTIFEGRWDPTPKGMRLQYLVRYSWQLSRKPVVEFGLEATRSDLVTTLAWEGEKEKQLNGNVPAIVGTDDFYWVELVREGATAGLAAMRWNEDCEEPPSWTVKEEPMPRKGSDTTPEPALHQRRPAAAEAPGAAPAAAGGEGSEAARAAPAPTAPAPKGPAARGAKPAPVPVEEIEPDTESPLPLYVGFAIFVIMAASFVYLNWEEEQG